MLCVCGGRGINLEGPKGYVKATLTNGTDSGHDLRSLVHTCITSVVELTEEMAAICLHMRSPTLGEELHT